MTAHLVLLAASHFRAPPPHVCAEPRSPSLSRGIYRHEEGGWNLSLPILTGWNLFQACRSSRRLQVLFDYSCAVLTRKGSLKTLAFDKGRGKHRSLSTSIFKASIDIIVMLLPISELLRSQERDGGKEEGPGGGGGESISLGSKWKQCHITSKWVRQVVSHISLALDCFTKKTQADFEMKSRTWEEKAEQELR